MRQTKGVEARTRIGWGCSLRNGSGTFIEPTSFEAGSGSGQGDEVGCVHGPPEGLGGLDGEGHGMGGDREDRGTHAQTCAVLQQAGPGAGGFA